MASPEQYIGGFTETNAWLIGGEDEQSPVLVDAPYGVDAWLASREITPAAVLLTHLHFDHVLGLNELLERMPNLPVFAHSAYDPALTLEQLLVQMNVPEFAVTTPLAGEKTVEVAGHQFELFYIPGHSVDSLAFYQRDAGFVFTGDTLMESTIGRCDFPNGSQAQLVSGIQQHLFALEGQTQVFPGHGGATTIAKEKQENPFL